jgi:long-chain acyl-CoA synthetase
VSLRTLNDIFLKLADRQGVTVMKHREAIDWVSISTQELYRKVVGVALALEEWGIGKGDRVAILSENRPEWTITDFACLAIGAVVVPIYATLTDRQTAALLNDAGVRAVAVSTQLQLDKVLSIRDQTFVEKIMVMDHVETARAVPMSRLMNQAPTARVPEFEDRARSIRPDDLATIIYTSGTTGSSKGVMLTHGNMASNIACSLLGFGIGEGEVSISFLPLSHVTARHVDFAMLYHGVTLAYCSHLEKLPQALTEIRPSIFVAVPRVYEKIYLQVLQKTKELPASAIYQWAIRVGKKYEPQILKGEIPEARSWRLANKLVYSQVRAGIGGNVKLFISGGAPLGRELADWFATIGIRIHEGYGLTETSPVIAVNTPHAHKLGTVGKPLPNVEVRIAEDGEVLVRGPSIFSGYWKKPEETQAAFEGDWFRTGDIGNLDADGFLSITDRKKDLIKTSGGKFIAPQPIENSLKLNPLVGTAVVLGDKRKFPAVLISPHFALLEEWAQVNGVSFASRTELVANPKIQELYDGIVSELNQNLARFEQLKKVILVDEEFSAATGTLTPTMKVRRRGIEDHYRDKIEKMYRDAETAPAVSRQNLS